MGLTTTLTAAGGISYVWQAGGATTNPFTTPVINGPTTYTVTGTNSGGCTATAIANITIAPPLTITVNNPSYCLDRKSVVTASGGTNYNWSPAAGLSAVTGNGITANPADRKSTRL